MSLELIVFVGFLLINLLFGIFAGRGVNNITLYAVGNRNFSTATITATIIATWIGSGFFYSAVSETYKEGLWHLIARFGDVLTLLIVGYVIGPKVGRFFGKISVAEIMGDLYGERVRFITAISSILLCTGYVAVQIKVLIELLNYFFGVSSFYAVILATVVIVTYSTMGGIKSVTFTDVIQFVTFGVFIPVLAIFLWKIFDNPTGKIVSATLANPLFSGKEVFDIYNPKLYSFFILFLYYTIPGLDPATIQRILMAKDTAQVCRSFSLAAFFCFIIGFAACLIGIIMLAHNPNLDPNTLIEHVIENHSYPGLKALILVGITAMIMSSADSYINSAAVIFSHDLIKTTKHTLDLSRIFSIFVGILATILALSQNNLYELLLLAGNFYTPVITVPLLLAILGFRTTTRVTITAIFSGIFTVVVWRMFVQSNSGIDSIIPGTVVNLLVMLSMHYLLKESGGWAKQDSNSPEISNLLQRSKAKTFNIGLSSSIFKFDLLSYCKLNIPRSETIYIYSIFSAVSVIIITLSIAEKAYYQHFYVVNALLGIVLLMVTNFICHKLWPSHIRDKYLGFIWLISIFFISSFSSSFLVFLSDFTHISLVVLVLNLTVIGMLLSWQSTLWMIILGLILSFIFYQEYVGEIYVSAELNDLKFKVVYILFMISSTLIAFLKPKQDHQKLTEEKAEHLASTMDYKDGELQKALTLKNEFIRNVTHEYHAPMTGVINNLDSLLAAYDMIDDYGRKKAIETIYNSAIRLESFDSNIRDLARLSSNEAELNIAQVNLSELVLQRLEACTKLYIEQNRRADYEFVTHLEENVVAEVDEYYLTQTLDNLIINAFSYCKKGSIKLELKKKNINIAEFSITDEGIGVPKDELEEIFGSFTVSSKTRSPAGGRGVGLALCKRVLEMHKGEIKAESSGGRTTFTFFLPLVFDIPSKPPSEEVIEIAKNLLKEGANVKLITKVTGLRASQIKAIEK